MDIVRFRARLLRVVGLLCAALMLLFGYVIGMAGYRVIGKWGQISRPYAGIGVLWMIAGLVMLASALGLLLSAGRDRVPLLAGSVSAVAAGTSLIAGVLTYVVPCAGPS